MAEQAQTLGTVRREPLILRLARGIALLRESPIGMIGAALVVFWLAVAIFAPYLAPFAPNNSNVMMSGDPNSTAIFTHRPLTEYILDPGNPVMMGDMRMADDVCTPITEGKNAGKLNCGMFWLGTDGLGRDVLSRLIWGARRVLFWAPLATLCAYLVGVPMGLAAGYRGAWVDDSLSFLANIILSFPVLVLYIVLITLMGGPSGLNVVIAVTFASAPGIFRIVRGLTLDLRTREYVAASEIRGESVWWIIFIELLPNARGPLIVDSMLRLGYTIITIGVLGFLGLGLPPPNPDWGAMISEFRTMLQQYPHIALVPVLAISSLVLGFNLLADGLREVSLRD
jgi:ABC-type dipeptide/oligopeptide/nickel transport system permease subunit